MTHRISTRAALSGLLLTAITCQASDQTGCPGATTAAWQEPAFTLIGHRGASGHVPEHTLASYALAALEGADYVEMDLVSTKDGQLVARHDDQLDLTTDVAQHPEFARRKRTQKIDGVEMTGWFSEDFTLAEIKTLRAIERIPDIRPGNARLDGAFEIPTLQEILDLVQGLECAQHRRIGIYIETKHPTHFQQLGLALEKPLLQTLADNGYRSAQDPVYIESFEVDNLKQLHQLGSLRLVQLFDAPDIQPYDQQVAGSPLTFGQMASAQGLRNIAQYAQGVGPDKGYIIPRNSGDNLGNPTDFVANAHAAGLKVHPYTFRAENSFLPAALRSGEIASAIGNIDGEIQAFREAGIDGLFIDQPSLAVRQRQAADAINRN